MSLFLSDKPPVVQRCLEEKERSAVIDSSVCHSSRLVAKATHLLRIESYLQAESHNQACRARGKESKGESMYACFE